MQASPIKVIFFDAVGTLFDVKGSVGEVYMTYAKKYGVPNTQEKIQDLNVAFKETMKSMPPPIFSVTEKDKLKQCERLWWFDVVHGAFYRVGMFEGFDDFFDEVFQAFGQPFHWKLFPETIEVLSRLKSEGFELGIISNFDTRFFQIFRSLGLDGFFDSVTISSLAGAVKPNKKIFAHALDQHMVLPNEALHVGDNLDEDFEGAQQAGLHAVLVDRESIPPQNSQTLSGLALLPGCEFLSMK